MFQFFDIHLVLPPPISLLPSPSSLLHPPSSILLTYLYIIYIYIYALPARPPGASCRSQGYPIQWVCSTCHTYIYSNTCLQHITNIGLHVRPQMHVNPKLGLHVRPQIHVNKIKVSKRSQKRLKKVSKRSSLFVDMCRYWKRGFKKVSKRCHQGLQHVSTCVDIDVSKTFATYIV